MDPITALLIGAVAPALVAVAIVIAAHLVLAGRAPRWGALTVPLALAAGYGLAYQLVLGWPALPPVDVTQASPWLAVFAAIIAVPAAQLGRTARVIVSAAFGLALGAWLVAPLVPHALDSGLAVVHVVAVATSFVAMHLGLARGLAALEPAAGAGVIAALAGGSALAILLSDVASLGQVSGALAAAAGALLVLGLVRPRMLSLAPAALVVAAIVLSNLWSAALYAAMRYEVVALLVLTPLAVVAARRWLLRPRRTIVRALLPAMLATVVVGIAAGLAATHYFGGSSAASGEPVGTTSRAATTPAAADPDYGY